MLDCLAVCGDSFGVGHGISQEPKETISKSFGGVVAEHYDLPLKMFARSGCCNYVIYLQVKKIIEQFKSKKINPFVLITTTHHSRFVFPSETEKNYITYDLSDVDYKNYNFFPSEKELEEFLPFKLNDKPRLFSETLSNLFYFMEKKQQNLGSLFLSLKKKIDLIDKYYKYLYSDSIKSDYDNSLIVMMHLELKIHNIPHLLLAPSNLFLDFIDHKNFLENNWGYYVKKYPDHYRSGHCTDQGHKELSEKIIEKIDESSYDFFKK